MAHRLGARLELLVWDNGHGPVSPERSGSGIGLANTRARLEALYGGESRLELDREDGATVARIVLPVRSAEDVA